MAWYIYQENSEGVKVPRPYDGPLTPGMRVFQKVQDGDNWNYDEYIVNQSGEPIKPEFRYGGGGSTVEMTNPDTGAWERSVVNPMDASGTQIPISVAAAQGIPYQYTPGLDTSGGGIGGLLTDAIQNWGPPAAMMYGAYGLGSMLNGAFPSLNGPIATETLNSSVPQFASYTADAGSGLVGGNASALGMGGGAASPLGTGLQVGAGSGGLGGAPLSASLADSVLAGGGTMGGLGFAGSGGAGLLAAAGGAAGAAGAAGGAAGAGTAASAGSTLSRVMSGNATATDYLSLGLPIAGALTGGMAGSQKPAGTTTTTQDVPDWQRPYVQSAFNAAQGIFNQQQGDPTATNLAKSGASNLQATINGDYLNPASNPYLQATYDKAARSLTDTYNYTTMPQLSRTFGNQQAFGGNSAYNELFQKANQGLATGLADLGTGIYGGNFQAERGRQFTGALGANDYASGYSSTPYSNLNNYANLVTRPMGSQSQQPYFTNPVGGALSGALGGYALSNLFGK